MSASFRFKCEPKDDTIQKNPLNEIVKLNVGGYLFQTTIATLVSHHGMLKSMFEINLGIGKDPDGFIFIDRDGEYFSEILNFLRKGYISLLRPRKELENILAEADFYQIEPLICILREKLTPLLREENFDEQGIITLLDDWPRMEKIIETASRPVVYLGVPQGEQWASENAIYHIREAHKLYKDVFQFILHLNANKSSSSPSQKSIASLFSGNDSRLLENWVYYLDGKSYPMSAVMISSRTNATIQLFAENARKAKE